jgi:hypothetical protein
MVYLFNLYPNQCDIIDSMKGVVNLAGKFHWQKFSAVDLNDCFFDSLKSDYPEFVDWFQKKQKLDQSSLVYNDADGIGAFLYLKRENIDGDNSPLIVNDEVLPDTPRLKIGTLRLAERIRKQRLGEGALGVALWYWRETKCDEIYVTVFDKHTELINLFERFGFFNIGKNDRGESVYLKSKRYLDYSDPYKSFPFIANGFDSAGLLPIDDVFHDRLFPYSELAGNNQEIFETTAGNGITKVFLAAPYTPITYRVGMPIFIYRIHTGDGKKAYKSVVTSYCTISKVDTIKRFGLPKIPLDEYLHMVGNKSVYTSQELTEQYHHKNNLIAIEMVYNGYFGKGHNVIYKDLKENGLFKVYPYNIVYNQNEFVKILEMGDVDVQNTIID